MEILQRIAKEIDVWIYIENDIITFDEIFSPEVFKFEFQSESGYKYKLEHVCWIVVDLFSFTPCMIIRKLIITRSFLFNIVVQYNSDTMDF